MTNVAIPADYRELLAEVGQGQRSAASAAEIAADMAADGKLSVAQWQGYLQSALQGGLISFEAALSLANAVQAPVAVDYNPESYNGSGGFSVRLPRVKRMNAKGRPVSCVVHIDRPAALAIFGSGGEAIREAIREAVEAAR